MRPIYRTRQFWSALKSTPRQENLEKVKGYLSPMLLELFLKQHPSEQVHSLKTFQRLYEQGERCPDLLVAALLHDAGKSRFKIRLMERVWVVLGQKLVPKLACSWGEAEPAGLKRPFVIAKKHPLWGAELAQKAGASPVCIHLIQRHHETRRDGLGCDQREEDLLRSLQRADNES